MEFNLIPVFTLNFHPGSIEPNINIGSSPKRPKIDSITKTHTNCKSAGRDANLNPVIDDSGAYSVTHCEMASEMSTYLLFGMSNFKDKLISGLNFAENFHFTLNSSNVGRLMIKTYHSESDSNRNEVNIFEVLHKVQKTLPRNSMEVIVCLRNFGNGVSKWKKMQFIGIESKLTQELNGGPVTLETADFQFPEDIWWEEWKADKVHFTGRFSLDVKLEMDAVTQLYKRRFMRAAPNSHFIPDADMVYLMDRNRDKKTAILCHKSILSETSPVFASMFQTDSVNSNETSLEIVDCSEACVRALIEFVYQRDVEEVLRSCEITLELLQLADKYEMKELKNILRQIIWCMPCTWFSVDMLLKLIFYTNDAGAGKDLVTVESKGSQVLKWYRKKYPEKYKESINREDNRYLRQILRFKLVTTNASPIQGLSINQSNSDSNFGEAMSKIFLKK